MRLHGSLHVGTLNMVHEIVVRMNTDMECELDWGQLSELDKEAKRLREAYDRWVYRKVQIAEEKLRKQHEGV